MRNLNQYIASTMRSILCAKKGSTFDFEDIRELCCMPQFKFL